MICFSEIVCESLCKIQYGKDHRRYDFLFLRKFEQHFTVNIKNI